jgi:hypothetical protein
MLTLPDESIPNEVRAVLAAFAPLFTGRTFAHVQVLLTGAILTPGRRTVAAALRAMGLAKEKHFQNYHRVLNRAVWSNRKAAKVLLGLLVQAFAADGPLVLGIDETLERRRGAKIAAKGIYRDAVRSSRSFFAKSSGLRWVSLMLLCPISWAGRVWALPFLTVLAPSERYHQARNTRHKKLTDWARQMLRQVRRWLPDRTLVVVADAGYAVLDLLHQNAEFVFRMEDVLSVYQNGRRAFGLPKWKTCFRFTKGRRTRGVRWFAWTKPASSFCLMRGLRFQ